MSATKSEVLRRSVEPTVDTVEKLDSRFSGGDFGGLKLILRMTVRFAGAGGFAKYSTSTTAKRRDVIARVFRRNELDPQAR